MSSIALTALANGTTANEVNWLAARTGSALPNLARMALLAHNEWLEKILADMSDDSYAVKVIRNKPATLKDTCWEGDGTKHEEPFTLQGPSVCNGLFPIYATVRIAAGGPLEGDILKCRLSPIDFKSYAVDFTPAEKSRLRSIFPQGVCDYSKRGVKQRPLAGTWHPNDYRFMGAALASFGGALLTFGLLIRRRD